MFGFSSTQRPGQMSRATKRDPKHLQGWVSTCSMKLELEYAKAFFVAMMRMVWWEEKYVMVSSNVSIAIMMGVVGMAERQVGGHEWITGHFRLKADPPLLLHTAHCPHWHHHPCPCPSWHHHHHNQVRLADLSLLRRWDCQAGCHITILCTLSTHGLSGNCCQPALI